MRKWLAAAFGLAFLVSGCKTGGNKLLPPPGFSIEIGFTANSRAGDGFVFLDWEDYPLRDTDFLRYVLSRGTSPNGPWTVIAYVVTESQYTDTTVQNGAQYCYIVQIETRSRLLSQPSEPICLTPQEDTTPPAPPTGLVAGAGDNLVILQWAAPDDPDRAGFRIYRNTVPAFDLSGFGAAQFATPTLIAQIDDPNATQYTDETVQNFTTYYYVVTTFDAAGNESAPSNVAQATPLPDTDPPETTLTEMPPAISNSPDATFSFTSDEAGSTFLCSLDGAPPSPCTPGVQYTGLSDGTHRFEVAARDPSGNIDPTPATYEWVIDTQPPQVTVQAPAEVGTGNDFQVTWNATDTGGTGIASHSVFFSLDGTNFDPVPGCQNLPATESSCTLTAPPDQVTDNAAVRVVSTDQAGNEGQGETTFSIVDDDAPTVNILQPNGGEDLVAGDPILVEWTASDNIGVTSVSLSLSPDSGTTWNPIPECQNLPGTETQCSFTVPADTHADTFRVRAEVSDAAGNTAMDASDGDFSIQDQTPPTVTVTAPNGGENWTTGDEFTITWVAEDPVTRPSGYALQAVAQIDVFYSTDGGNTWIAIPDCQDLPPTTSSCDWTVPDVVTNQALVRVEVTDTAGLMSSDVSDDPFNILDNDPPTVEVFSPSFGDTLEASEIWEIRWSSSDNIGIQSHNLWYSIDGGNTFQPIPECTDLPGDVTSCGWTVPNGDQWPNTDTYIQVCATDTSGNEECGSSDEFTIQDTTPPDVTIDPVPSPTNADTLNFTFEATDTASGVNTVECSLDGGTTWFACTSPHTESGLCAVEGNRTFDVRATDVAGNTGQSQVTWVQDCTAPTLNWTDTPPEFTNQQDVTFSWNVADNFDAPEDITQECDLDGGGWNPCTSPHDLMGLAEGQHTFTVRATDRAGNAATLDYSFWVDLTPPETTIDQGPPNPSGSPDASFQFSGTDNISDPANLTFECQLDGGGWYPCTSPDQLTGLADGNHTYEVRAIDQAGNVDPSPASYMWLVDTTPPMVNLTAPADGEILLAPSTFNIEWQAQDPDPASGLASFDLEYSTDGGATWNSIAAGLDPNTVCAGGLCSYDWTLHPDLFGGNGMVRVTATDLAGNSAQASQNVVFAFYERFESEADPTTPGLQHDPNNPNLLRKWYVVPFGPGNFDCGANNPFRWFFAQDGNPNNQNTEQFMVWARCLDNTTGGYAANPNELLALVAGPFDFPATPGAAQLQFLGMWDLEPPEDLLLLVVSEPLPSPTTTCDQATNFEFFGLVGGTSPDFPNTWQFQAIDLTAVPTGTPIPGTTRCLGFMLFDANANGDGGGGALAYLGPMLDDIVVYWTP